MSLREVSPTQAKALMDQGWYCIDVRSPAEWNSTHVQGAYNLPLDTLNSAVQSKHALLQGKLVLICQSGGRSRKALEKLTICPEIEAVSVIGGTAAWKAEGLPIISGRGVISIERQVRIVAGALVFIGTALGLTFHSGFLGIPLFVGAGLTISGVADLCGMGILLSKMPWNQVKPERR